MALRMKFKSVDDISMEYWASLVGGNIELAHQCDTQLFPTLSGNIALGFVCPPKEDAGEFLARLACSGEALVLSALALNDYALADSICEFERISPTLAREAREFARLRDMADHGYEGPWLADLALCSLNASVSANLLSKLTDPTSMDFSWTSRLAVLLEAKAACGGLVGSLAELVLGIETLPNEPELLKNHLSRMHSQRGAIMSLVDRVDLFRHGQVNDQEDFLADAIRTLDHKQGSDNARSSFLIQFLQYLSKVCQARGENVSLFEVLSEEPADLVGHLVFNVNDLGKAKQLCYLMGLDLTRVVADQSVKLSEKGSTHYITLSIVEQLPQSDLLALLCVERRTLRWPSTAMLAFAQRNSPPKIVRWIEERADAWTRFAASYKVLRGDCSAGFTEEEEAALPVEFQTALRAVAQDSQESMNALALLVARARMSEGDYIGALNCLDESHDHIESNHREALIGSLTNCTLEPTQIYQLLWRIESGDELLPFAKKFIQSWDYEIALKTLELCLERLNGEAWVEKKIRVVRTMASVVQVCGGHSSWQELEAIETEKESIRVIDDLLAVHHHGLAEEFLDIQCGKSIEFKSVDTLAEKIEISRLRFMYVASEDKCILMDRLRVCHHPLKASSLGVALVNSLESLPDRIRLGQMLLANGIACAEDARDLETQLASLTLLACGGNESIEGLLNRPDLILETLLMNGNTKGMCVFLASYPSWRNDYLLLTLAHKALGLLANDQTLTRSSWQLTGDLIRDNETRKAHRFARVPDVSLALKFLRLCEPNSLTNEMTVKQFCHELSLFIPQFLPRGPVFAQCRFQHLSFLRHAILAMSPGCESQLTLIADLWTECQVAVGLETFSGDLGPLCDKLIAMDKMGLATRLVGTNRKCDAITLRQVDTFLKLGHVDRANCVLEGKELSIDQLRELRDSLKTGRVLSLEELRVIHRRMVAGHAVGTPEKGLEKKCSWELICTRFATRECRIILLLEEGSVDVAVQLSIKMNLGGAALAALVTDHLVWPEVIASLKRHDSISYMSGIEVYLRSQPNVWETIYPVEVSLGRDCQAAVAAIQMYLRAPSWEAQMGFLTCASRHLACSNKVSERFRLRRLQRKREEDEEDSETDDEDDSLPVVEELIAMPFALPDIASPSLDLLVPTMRTLVELQIAAAQLMPTLPASASLFGCIQAVSELIDYLLMDTGTSELGKLILTRMKLPDSALCGIFH